MTGISWTTTRRLTVGAAGALVAGALVGALARSPAASPAALGAGAGSATITVTGSASASAVPDEMTLTVALTHTAASATAALGVDNTETALFEHVLRTGGVARRDLQTTSLELNPTYNDHGRVTGYQASNQLSVTVRNLARAGTLIDDATAAVGNDVTIGGISFGVSDDARLVLSARVAALRQAAATAAALARAAGARLGQVKTVTTRTEQPPPVVFSYPSAMAAPTHASAVPVQAGVSTVNASATVVYSLVP